jgi:pyruvate/2-oxoglutarate dehydrogenase complex dihydrolipoamide dehydrogenase (E3) component
MNKWFCTNCGYNYEGENSPDVCPECGATPEDFYPTNDPLLNANRARLKKVIIIGNGAAGMEAARTIGENNKTVEILLNSVEKEYF